MNSHPRFMSWGLASKKTYSDLANRLPEHIYLYIYTLHLSLPLSLYIYIYTHAHMFVHTLCIYTYIMSRFFRYQNVVHPIETPASSWDGGRRVALPAGRSVGCWSRWGLAEVAAQFKVLQPVLQHPPWIWTKNKGIKRIHPRLTQRGMWPELSSVQKYVLIWFFFHVN